MARSVTYAQNREDLILAEFLKDIKKGFYVDVGVNHSTIDSVTKYFYDKGWSGINIEPSPGLFEKIAQDRPRDINLNIGVAAKKSKLSFREYVGTGLSTFSDSMKKEYENEPNSNVDQYKDYDVEVATLSETLHEYVPKSRGIDFMKVDVEGYEYEVLQGNDWSAFRPKVICIEANHISKNWSFLLLDNKYTKVFNDGLNDYYVAEEEDQIAKNFYYPNILLRPHVVNYTSEQEINLLSQELKASLAQSQRLELENQIMNEKIYPLKYQIGILNSEIQKNKRIRFQLIGLAKSMDSIITMYINKLNRKNKRLQQTELVYKKEDIAKDEEDAIALQRAVRATDFDNLFSKKLGTIGTDSLGFFIVNGIYSMIKKMLKSALRKVWYVLKKVKG